VRDVVRSALSFIATRFSDDAPLIDVGVLQRKYTALDAWPADAQLGLAVLAWALGSGFSLKPFADAVNVLEPDFAAAERAIPMSENPTRISLESIARQCFRNTAVVVRWDLNPNLLYWPCELSSCYGAW
jgi:hypothetical protein